MKPLKQVEPSLSALTKPQLNTVMSGSADLPFEDRLDMNAYLGYKKTVRFLSKLKVLNGATVYVLLNKANTQNDRIKLFRKPL